jgi:DNA-binding GntR family transcriptional regulator
MTKENIFKSYLEDPLLIEKNYITPEKAANLKLIEVSNSKLIDVIKIAINGNIDSETESVISRKINQYLNK